MFKIKIADLIIKIDNKYHFTKRFCKDYIYIGNKTDFSVTASKEEIMQERKSASGIRKGFFENLCIYRKIGEMLPEHNAFIIHGVAIVKNNKVYLFLAKSGVGKSTHAYYWKKAFGDKVRILNGDKPILKKTENDWMVYGTPWNGKENDGFNGKYPLHSVCFLAQGKENRIQSLSRSGINDRIFHQVLIPRNENMLDSFLRLLDDLSTTIPFYYMECIKDESAAIKAYEFMK